MGSHLCMKSEGLRGSQGLPSFHRYHVKWSIIQNEGRVDDFSKLGREAPVQEMDT